MDGHMLIKSRFCTVGLSADITAMSIGTVGCVLEHVYFMRSFVLQDLATDFTFSFIMWVYNRMYVHMDSELVSFNERFATYVTLMWLLARMN